jgi:uncharacterized membrane protein
MPIVQMWTDSRWRSASKGISYRVFATVFTTAASFAMTGSMKTATLIGSVEVSVKILLYWAHERLWSRVTWGRVHEVVASEESPPKSAPEATGQPPIAPRPRGLALILQKVNASREA